MAAQDSVFAAATTLLNWGVGKRVAKVRSDIAADQERRFETAASSDELLAQLRAAALPRQRAEQALLAYQEALAERQAANAARLDRQRRQVLGALAVGVLSAVVLVRVLR